MSTVNESEFYSFLSSHPTEDWPAVPVGDMDQKASPYRYRHPALAKSGGLFKFHELGKLLQLRGRIMDARIWHGQYWDDLYPSVTRPR